MPLTPEEEQQIQRIVRQGTQEAIHETFKVLGVNLEDFASIEEFRQNQSWTSGYRKTAEKVGSNFLIAATTILTGGVFAAIYAYLTKR